LDQFVDIGSIKVKRALHPLDDGIAELAAHIKKHGQKFPIALSQTFELIDGLRRIEALKLLGHDTAAAVICESFEDITDELGRSRQGILYRTPTPKRIWDLNESCKPYIERRLRESRKSLRGLPQHSRMPVRMKPARDLLVEALGFNSDSFIGESIHVWNIAMDPDDHRYEMARELAERVEQGEFSLHGIRSRMERSAIFSGDVLTPGEQRNMLKAFIMNLRAVILAAQRMGPLNPKVPKEELRGYLKQIKDLNRELYIFAKTLEQEIEK